MNNRRISWGLIVLFIGLVLLLTNLDYIEFNWLAVFSLWPVLLILLGLSFMLPYKPESKYIMIVATVATLALFAYKGLRSVNDGQRFSTDVRSGAAILTRDLEPGVKFAKLNIEGGAISYRIEESTDKFFYAETRSNTSSFSLSDKTNGESSTLDFVMRGKTGVELNENNIQNNAIMRLNKDIVWDIDLKIGAGSAEFDLSEYKVRKVEVDGGVSSVNIKLGMPFENESTVELKGGLLSFELSVPNDAACRIVSKSALSSQDFQGFNKQEDGSYITDNYNTADKKFTINMNTGMSSFSVKRY
jgi:hypothetical protein